MLDPAVAAQLRDITDDLVKRTVAVPHWVCKAFVWAVYSGKDPMQAVIKAHYGDHGVEQLRTAAAEGIIHGSAVDHADEMLNRLIAAKALIPRHG